MLPKISRHLRTLPFPYNPPSLLIDTLSLSSSCTTAAAAPQEVKEEEEEQQLQKMKKLYPKNNKGKIHPVPSLSALNFLPSAILTLASALPVDDQQVLAFLILRSLNSSTTTSTSSSSTTTTTKCLKPTFHCGCFDCYTHFWLRWDSSPNRDLIHRAIDAFEDHLSRTHHFPSLTPSDLAASPRPLRATPKPVASPPPTSPPPSPSPDPDLPGDSLPPPPPPPTTADGNQGMVKKVWPDVLGIFNSRLWSLWSPTA